MASKKSRKNKKFKDSRAAKPVKSYSNKKNKVWPYFLVGAVVILVLYAIIGSVSVDAPEALGPSYGAENGEIEFVQFGCFTCPFTKQFNLNTVPVLVEEFSDNVTFFFRSAPISSNPGSRDAAAAAKCADNQDLFVEYSQVLFSSSAYDMTSLETYARSVGMDLDEFSSCMSSDEVYDAVSEDFSAARRAGVVTTPTTFVNGVKVQGAQDIALFRRLFNDMLSN
jgi:protein-disulfide isomerase